MMCMISKSKRHFLLKLMHDEIGYWMGIHSGVGHIWKDVLKSLKFVWTQISVYFGSSKLT